MHQARREAQPGPPLTSVGEALYGLVYTSRKQGVLTDDEFSAAKAKLFGT